MSEHEPEPGPPASGEPDIDNSAASRWLRMRERLEASRLALESQFEPTPEERSRVLKERAAELAREPREKAGAETQLEVVEFLLVHETYAIEPDFVRDIFPLKTLTPIPCTPSFVLGVTNLHGEILSVVDLKRFFELPDKGLTDLSKVIVLQSPTMMFGILADSIIGARPIALDEIRPVPPTLTDVREKYLKGVTQDRLAVLDAEKILCDQSIVVHEEVGR